MLNIKYRIQQTFNEIRSKTDWPLLLFLVAAMHVKLFVKVVTILFFAFLYRRELSSLLVKKQYILFYITMIGITILNTVMHISGLSIAYLMVAITGIGGWLLCAFSAGLVTIFIQKNSSEKLLYTLQCFFLLNALVTLITLASIMLHSGAINPYTYQGEFQRYFISTGDYMKGISFDTSTTNALFNSFGVIFFLSYRKMGWTILCMVILVLTSSNLTNLLLVIVFLYLFIFNSDRNQRSVIIVCLMILLIFQVKISPQNNAAAINELTKISFLKHPKHDKPIPAKHSVALVAENEKPGEETLKINIAKQYLDSVFESRQHSSSLKGPVTTDSNHLPILVTKPEIPQPNIHSIPYQINLDTTDFQKKLLAYAFEHIADFDTNTTAIRQRKTPGKLLSFRQTYAYFQKHPFQLVTGTGAGNFSSKLAFRSTGLGIAGGYPGKFRYVNQAFNDDHLNLYITYFSKHKELHSLIHTPNSAYDQLIAEYGIAGLLAFFLLYAGYFLKKIKTINYGLPLLIILLSALVFDYWFEQLSIVILFELLMLLKIKEAKHE